MIRDNKNDFIENKNEICELLKDYNVKMENNISLINTEIKKMKSNQEKLNKKIVEIIKRNSISKSKSLKKKKLIKKNSQEIEIKKNLLKNNLPIKIKNKTNSIMTKNSSSLFNNKNNNTRLSKNKNYLKKNTNSINNNNNNNNYNSTLSSTYFERYSKKRSTHKSSNSALFSNISDISYNPSFTNLDNSQNQLKKNMKIMPNKLTKKNDSQTFNKSNINKNLINYKKNFNTNKNNISNIKNNHINNNNNNINFNNNLNKDNNGRKLSIMDLPMVEDNKLNFLDCLINNEKNILNNIKSNYIKALYLTAKNNLTPINIRIKLTSSIKNIYYYYTPKNVIEDYVVFLDKKILSLNEDLNKLNFIPSKFSQFNFNFIKFDDERNFFNNNIDNNNNFDINNKNNNLINICENLLRIFLLSIGGNEENIDKNNYGKLLNEIFNITKGKIKNFICNLNNNNYINSITNDIIEKYINVSESINLINLDMKEINKISKSFGLIYFYLKEIYFFFKQKLYLINKKIKYENEKEDLVKKGII